MSDERKSQLSIAESAEANSVVGVEGASASRPDGRRRRRVSKDDAREIGRLYAETSTPTSEIRERFGIGDSSLYRIVQQQGVALRGRTARSQSKSPQEGTPAAQRGRSSRADQARQAISQPRPTKATTAARATRGVDVRSVGRPVRRAGDSGRTISPP